MQGQSARACVWVFCRKKEVEIDALEPAICNLELERGFLVCVLV